MGEVVLRRVREAVDARRESPTYLVDRLWPRGVRKDSLDVDAWLQDVAPSTGLRRWFGHDPERWAEFRERYRAELDSRPDAAQPLLDALRDGSVVLLYAAKDTEHNNAIVLRGWLLEQLGRPIRGRGFS
jgi:uncharacterized protein YeaO (DUF488 family)